MAQDFKKSVTKHDHPACQTPMHRHEKVPVGGSAGGDITEGCIEHYDERIVLVDDAEIKTNSTAREWRKNVIISEILSSPRCKRRMK